MINIIANVSVNGIIGKDNDLASHYTEDFKYFKRMTLNQTIIMGRNTFESMGSKPLPKRTNVVVSRSMSQVGNIDCKASLKDALSTYKDAWLIGGARIYEEGMQYADNLYITLSPDYIEGDILVRFPFINPKLFTLKSVEVFESDKRLSLAKYVKTTC